MKCHKNDGGNYENENEIIPARNLCIRANCFDVKSTEASLAIE